MFHEQTEPNPNYMANIQPSRVHLYFEQLRSEIVNILSNESVTQDNIHRLEAELNVYKRAYADLEIECRRHEKLKVEADKQKDEMEQRLKGHRIVALLDGDGAIFNTKLIQQGIQGGHTAAQKLSDAILQHLATTNGRNQYQLWIYIFFNKRGLMDAFARNGFPQVKAKLDDFMVGFNQATERFMMVDVGSAKEAADAKIKALLDDDIKLPQTEKIIFGGCHDNGYVTALRSQITAGFKHKLILLPSYTETAAGIADLELPSITVADLFISQKLGSSSPPQNSVPVTQTSPLISTASPKLDDATPSYVKSSDFFEQMLDALPFAPAEHDNEASKVRSASPSSSASYSSVLLQAAKTKRPATPDSSHSVSSDDDSLNCPTTPRLAPGTPTKHINPNVALSKHKPPPCTLFYLSNCKHASDCKYGHDYLLEAEHYREIRANAKKSPCPSTNKGELCLWGEDCCYGHFCPMTTKCHFFKQGRCKFVGADMHKEVKA